MECRRSTDSGRSYKLHMHETLSIGAIDQGEVEYVVRNETGILGEGELIVIDPEALHFCNPVAGRSRNF